MSIKSKIPPKTHQNTPKHTKNTPKTHQVLPYEVQKSYENNVPMGQKSQHLKGLYLRLPFYLNIVKPL